MCCSLSLEETQFRYFPIIFNSQRTIVLVMCEIGFPENDVITDLVLKLIIKSIKNILRGLFLSFLT